MKRLSKFMSWMIFIYVMVGVAVLVVLNSPKLRAVGNQPHRDRGASISVGERARIYRDRGSVVLVRTEAGWDEFMTLAVAKDDRGIALMVLRGQAFLAEPGTLVHIIDRGFDRRRVRVLEGPTENQDGWVSTAFLRPL